MGDLVKNAELIATELEEIGDSSIEIRDSAVALLEGICPNNPQIGEMSGVNVVEIADDAKADLTMLANFIKDGLSVLNTNLARVSSFSQDVDKGLKEIELWGWQMKLLAAGLFILPSFLVVGVGLVMLGLDVKLYQNFLSYFFLPLFTVVIIFCYIFCSAVLPISATNAGECVTVGESRLS